ncbi:MAG TPA: Gfo/Idh/MocA family oxidoreductase [Candidatus Brocadiia bacterium]|nr:Gfo/Idh/MocA family oxidoreductase [Candidatus Brocadiia bacterium]
MTSEIRYGFIGWGGIAGTHSNYLKKIPGVKFVAACDILPERLKDFAEKFGVPKENLFEDFNEMAKMKDLDAVSVCTPNKLHKMPTIACLKEGKHVLVEKPMAMNAKDAAAMVKAAEESGKLLVIGFQERFGPEAQALKGLIDKGMLGNCLFARCTALRRRGIPSWGVFGQKELQGGGPMIDIGVHIVECAHYLLGRPKPVSAYGATYTYLGNKKPEALSPWGDWDYKTYTVEDLAIGMIRFENGATLSIEASFAAHIETSSTNIIIMGDKGGCSLHPAKVFTDQHGLMFNMTPEHIKQQDHFEVKMNHFIDCVRTGKPSDAPGIDGVVVQKMLDGIYESAEKGREVKIK